GALALAPTLLDRAEGHRHTGGRGAVLGGVAVMAGLWLLVTGYPREADGRAPSWWGVSLAALSAFGAVVGVALW
ncbi:MAG: hypothetical protein JNM74_24315, partial [Myxococcales bacterium]|nr:hypothetical protein [Myxococcales bacterium]